MSQNARFPNRYVIDTNVLYDLVFDDGHCNGDNVISTINGNISVVTYGTLFEAFSKHKSKEAQLSILSFLNHYKFEVAGNSQENDDLFWKLVYYEGELTELGLNELKRLLTLQTSNYVCGVLGQILYAFAVQYLNMRLNKADDDFTLFVKYSAHLSDGFSHFPDLVKKFFDHAFSASYIEGGDMKFSDILKREFWGIIRIIEIHYIALAGKNRDYLTGKAFNDILKEKADAFDQQYSEKDYLSFIKRAKKDMNSGNKMFTHDTDFFTNSNFSNLTALETDFMKYYLRRLFVNQGMFKYNDIIDFMNLSIAKKYTDGIITCDKEFLNKTVSTFESIVNTKFYADSLKICEAIQPCP